jgi:hypothetical protein
MGIQERLDEKVSREQKFRKKDEERLRHELKRTLWGMLIRIVPYFAYFLMFVMLFLIVIAFVLLAYYFLSLDIQRRLSAVESIAVFVCGTLTRFIKNPFQKEAKEFDFD